MKTKKDVNNGIEREIFNELRSEIRELRNQGKLFKFETAMDHAMEKFKNELNRMTEEEIEECRKESSVKKNPVLNVDGKLE